MFMYYIGSRKKGIRTCTIKHVVSPDLMVEVVRNVVECSDDGGGNMKREGRRKRVLDDNKYIVSDR